MTEEDNSKSNDLKKELDDLQKELTECQKLKEEYLAGWQRATADLLNYKKEEIERVSDILERSNEMLILKILPILDSFEISEKNLPEQMKNDENIKGLLLIKKQIQDFLKSQGVEEISSVGNKFDINLHELVAEVEVENGESGIIVEEVQKGYKINGRLLRPAKVKVVKQEK